MLTIRREQMAVFSAAMRASFENRMVAHMHARSSQSGSISPDALRSRTLSLIDLAEKHGIDTENDIRLFLEMAFDQPPDSLQTAQIKAILNNGEIASSAKVAFLADLLLT